MGYWQNSSNADTLVPLNAATVDVDAGDDAQAGDAAMPKGYVINTYRAIHDPLALAAYAKLAGPAVEAFGGRILVRGSPVKTYEEGLALRAVVVEFDSVEKAQAAYESDRYQDALRALGNGADRDIRIVEGV